MDGDVWNSSCNLCQCQSKNVTCTKIACPAIDCSAVEIPTPYDSCCPQCDHLKKPCFDGPVRYIHNDVWYSQLNCILHQCQNGVIIPFVIQCPSIVCSQAKKLKTVPGECCPKCVHDCSIDRNKLGIINTTDECVDGDINTGTSKNCVSIPGSKEKLNARQKDQCTLCVSNNNEEKCYSRKCPACGLNPHSFPKQPCCSCVQNVCAGECATCLKSDQSYCLDCKDRGRFLHQGKCIIECPVGYYGDENKECKSCSLSCKTCFGNMTSQCSSCEKGYLLQKGRCVKSCDSNFYASEGYCFECHESCLSCVGPNSSDCISCALSGQLLQDGTCVDECIGHFYVADGYCLACNESCARCLKDGTCQFCEDSFYLEEEYCVPECTPGYYKFIDAYCLPCHDECQSCFGPLPYQCTSCPFGQFLLENSCVWDCGQGYFGDLGAGICGTCHPDCRSCLGGASKDKCLTCSSGYLLPYIGTHFGNCVEECPIGYYLTDNGNCAMCYETCGTCYGSNDTDCTSCNSPLFLKEGKCVPHCSNGYFQDGGICYACHPSCATCYGFNDDECYTCPFGRTFKYGKCIPSCGEGNYMNSDSICTSCHDSCSDCLLNSTDGSGVQCLQCKNQQLSVLYGECVPDCPLNFYLNSYRICQECHPSCATCERNGATSCVTCWNGSFLTHLGTCEAQCHQGYFPSNGVCQACDLKCTTCSNLNKCTSCNVPLLLNNGECMDDCGTGQYADYEALKCKSCSLGCAFCSSFDECLLCKDGYQLHNSICFQLCPENYFEDSVFRICKRSFGTPSLIINNNMLVHPGSSMLITNSVLNMSHIDSDKLYVVVHSLPQNSHLQTMTNRAEKVQLKPGDNFTSKQLEDGWVFFNHFDGMPLLGDLTLKISDGHKSSNNIVLPTQIISKFPPQLQQTDYIVISEESLIIIDPSVLFVEDKDNIADVTLNFIQGPCLGKLLLMPNETEISTITYEEYARSKLAFKSLKTTAIHEDAFIVQAFDGFNSRVTDVKLIILPKYSDDLVIVRNKSFYFEPGETFGLTNDFLLSVGENLKPSDVVYTINRSMNPAIGRFFKLSNDGKNKEIKEEQIMFTQTEIDNELISYNHPYNISSKLKIKAENRISKFAIAFDFEVIPLKQEFDIPMEANQFGMMVLQNHPATISNDHLLVEVIGVPPSDIVYMITKKLLKEEGFLENFDQPGIRLQSFTQNDIDNLKIVYHPPPYGGASEKQFMFQFVVIDAKSGSQLSPVQNFTITVTPPNTDFTSPASSIDYESTILVTQGQSVKLGQNWLSTIGHELPDDQLEVVLTNAPQYGILVQILGDARTELAEEDGFSFTSIIDDMFYEHDGSNNLHDSAVFSIMGGRHSSLNRVKFEISPNDRESPVILDSTTLMGSVTEGKSLNLQRYHLAYTDLLSGDADISFTLLSMPKYGILEKQENGDYNMLKPNDRFTQLDINEKLIRYSANLGIGDDTVRDFLYFDVSDASGNVQSNQVLTMKVKPRIKLPPVLKVVSDVQVNEGGEAVIQPGVLTVFDPDSSLSDLTVVIEKQPDYGFIENSRPIPGAENDLAGIPISSFPYIDLVEGYIKYMQAGHQGMEPEQDTVYIRIDDGRLSSPQQLLNITIRPVNDETPHVFSDVLFVHVGSYAKITNSTLSVVDADTKPEQLIITFEDLPKSGVIKKLKKNSLNFKNSNTLSKQDSFSFQDILNGLILYVHEDFKSFRNDSFGVIISDGHHNVPETISVVVVVTDREVPFLIRNLGLELAPGNSSIITNATLCASDADSPDNLLTYSLISDPTSGQLQLFHNGEYRILSSNRYISNLDSFTQDDINHQKLKYQHNMGEPLGMHYFKFNIKDPANNTLLDQALFITISEDIFPPMITRNTGLKVDEKGHGCISSEMLAAVDEHKKNLDLTFIIMSSPAFGYLEHKQKKAFPLTTFLMSDLKASEVCYVHTSLTSLSLDSFTFTVSDGKNSVLQTFYINITSIYDSLPAVKLNMLQLLEGNQKIITEFEIDVFDKDSRDQDVVIKIIKPPTHGVLKNAEDVVVQLFSVRDIKQGKISYSHDGSESNNDNFTMNIFDEINEKYIFISNQLKNITTKDPIVFPIKIIQIDDEFPKLVKNEGIKDLKIQNNKKMNIITSDMLYTEDLDTDDKNIIYKITLRPRLGFLQFSTKDGMKISNFSQSDINDGLVQYILKNDDFHSNEDKFIFSVEDTKPNKLFNNIFKIEWSRVSFNSSFYNISETDGILKIPVLRSGSNKKDSVAFCKVEEMNPVSKRDQFIIPVTEQVHFEENTNVKNCEFKLIDNLQFEGKKQYKILLESSSSLLGNIHIITVDIFDEEDEPAISFAEKVLKVNETGNLFHFPVIRNGDLNHELSVMCTTSDLSAHGSSASALETGSDFKSRPLNHKSFITFPVGVSEIQCSVKIIDDNLYEEEEKFQLTLSDPHPFGKLQNDITAVVIINGPNDVPQVSLKKEHRDIFQEQKNISIQVLREGVDLSKECVLFCGARMSTASEENLLSLQEIRFKSYETTIDCQLPLNLNENSYSVGGKVVIFLNSPVGCVLSEQNVLSFPLKKEKIKPIVEFSVSQLTVKEDAGSIQIPVSRTKDLTQNSTLFCITHDGSAHGREDFEERYLNRKVSIITFSSNQKESACVFEIYNDDIYEGKESFTVELVSHSIDTETVIGNQKTAVIEIIDPEDVTVIQLEKNEYVVSQHIFPNNISTSAVIAIIRYGDTSVVSKIRVSTIDGSASSGLDYYAKSKLLSFSPGEKRKNFEIEILYNKRRNWAVSFTVILGPDEVLNADIGNISKAVVRIASVHSTESLILPAVPLVVSLLHYDNVSKGVVENPKSGYPLICITPCDTNYPDYATTGPLCKESGINSSSISYTWEIAMPLDEERISPFESVVDSTLFTSAHNKVLDSIYFRPQERVRCAVQPRDSNNHLGIPLQSKMVKISSDTGFCHSIMRSPYAQLNLQSQPFTATLNYINSSNIKHPNKLHIHIQIPHEDGLLPLISTYPLHNIQFLLTQNIYRQQHVCSNLQSISTNLEKNKSFLKSFNPSKNDINLAFPYHGDKCQNESGILYQHLDLKRCRWSFDAWYSMSELVELCGGTVTSDFKARDSDQTYMTVLLPLYVTYVFAAAPTGWTSLEHRTEMEFSFYYSSFLWKSGAHSDNSLNAIIGMVRVGTNSAGHMFFEFKTVAKFYGCFVLDHHTLPGVKSSVSAPNTLDVQFDLELLWSEQTFDGPIQFWRSTSKYNLKDYSGYYNLFLIPCKVTISKQISLYNGYKYLPCIAQAPERFELPIVFQQTNRPSPVTYALETFFQIFNNENVFLLNPFENSPNFQYIEYKEAFSRGENVYGRVFWSPQQGLESAYKLNINEVIICSGKNGFAPVYDPTGKIYGKGPQYGCLIPDKNLKYKFILLDKHNPDAITTEIHGKSFNARFIEEIPHYATLSNILGVDGFVFNIDPLYEISSSQQWFLQVIYFIKPNRKTRIHRSVDEFESPITKEGNGSNIRIIFLDHLNAEASPITTPVMNHSEGFHVYFGLHHLLYIISALLIILGIVILRSKRSHFEEMFTFSKISRNSYAFRTFFEMPLSLGNSTHNEISEVQCKQKLKKKEVYKVKIYKPNKELYSIDNSSGTEV
ncbi:extracellular matrix protein FRAS1 [Trichonephila inaurata madagascariensis]|uniref:Extracellular matrix protein FRAS1 n=1 Tax=Trichonephila inaurata madagascariensis TaxID=2747483 RepID=A0A8X6YPF5_9ARAC|nr:extracellular matrix protein FRAS1 [Trichonephila inaurata madagascariensis]